MVLSGYESDHLYVLLSASEPFNQFEFDEWVNEAQKELRIPSVENRNEAVEIIATCQIMRSSWALNDKYKLLSDFVDLYQHDDDTKSLLKFYEIHCMVDELHTAAAFGYKQSYTREDLDREFDALITKWIDEHPMEKWAQFEWSKTAKSI